MKPFAFVIAIVAFTSCKHDNIVYPSKKDIIEAVYASGKIIADSEYSVYALNAGAIIKKLVREGDAVTKGQVLFIIQHDAPASRLDAAQSSLDLAQNNVSERSGILNDLKLAIETAQTKLTNDSLNYVRLNNLWKEGIGTKSNVDNAYTAYMVSKKQRQSAGEKYRSTANDLSLSLQNAKSQITVARSDLNNYFIRSSGTATVYQTFKEEGEAVRMNDAVALLGKTSQRIIRLAIDQQDINRIKNGQEVLLKTDVTGNAVYHAVISRIYPTMNEADQTFRADAVFTDSAMQQKYIHSSVEANIIIQKKSNVLVVPAKAFAAGNDSLQIKQDGRNKTIAVKTGIHTLDEVEITAGLDESSQVIIPPQQ